MEIRNGPTLMKIALHLKLGLKVIEVPLNDAGYADRHVIACIDRAVNARLTSVAKLQASPKPPR